MQILSKGIPVTIDEISRYGLPIDNPQEVIESMTSTISFLQDEMSDGDDENEAIIDSLSDFMLEKNNELDHLLDFIDDECPKHSKYRHIRKIVQAISTELYERG